MKDDGQTNTAHQAPARFVIAGWSLEEERHCLVRGGDSVKLEPKTTQLLAYMATHAGEPLSREDLLAQVWQGVVVGDEALTTAINKIRRAFGDSRHNPRMIETIPKMGYCLIAPVEKRLPADLRRDVHAMQSRPEAPELSAMRLPGRHHAWVGGARRLTIMMIGLGGLIIAALILTWSADEQALDDTATAAAVPAVAVLPFEVLGDDPEQQYLARGLTADLIAQLSRLSGLDVAAASVSVRPPGFDEDPSPDGRYEVWGGVRRDDEHLVIEVRLIEIANGRQLWFERYQRPFGDLFEVQDEIGAKLARALSVRVTEAERQRLAHRYTRSVAAYDLFLRAQSEMMVRTKENNERARELYLQALRLDPAFARAYAGLALIYAGDYRNQWSSERQKSLSQALEFANTAVGIAPMLPEIHWALAYVKVQQRQHIEALAHLDTVLTLEPHFADALALKGGIKTYLGEPAASIPLLRKAMRENPAAGYLYFMTLGRAYFFLGDQVLAVINLREAVTRNPASLEVHVLLAAALELNGDHADAAWEAEEIRAIDPHFVTKVWLETYPMVDPRQSEQLTAALDHLGL